MTNGEKLREVFPDIKMCGESKGTLDYSLGGMVHRAMKSWWGAEYREPSSSEKPNRWVPVSERLPEIGKKVLVTAYGRTCYAMMISADGNYGYPVFRLQGSLKERTVCETTAHSDMTSGRITAWMPLPEPYKAESEGKN